jgi:hypothetical protein
MTRLLQLDKIGNGGRLGNQLFTIASCIGIALRHGYTPRINEGWKYRSDFPNIPDEWFGPIVQGKPLFERVYEYDEGIDYHLSTRSLNSTLIGYFQSPYYWAGNENIIRRYLTPKGCNPGSRDAVAVHYRRGDYVGNPNYIQLKANYYNAGLHVLHNDNRPLVRRSDDHHMLLKYFDEIGGTELDDFIALAECKEHIISNSTFAWWAAYLSGGKVVAPREWFAGELAKRCSTKDLLPENWMLI